MGFFSKVEEAYLLKPKLLYLLLNMSVYSCYHFGPLYLASAWRIPHEHISFLSILTAVSFLGSVLWSSLTDRTGHHRLYLILLTVLFSAAFSLLQVPFVRTLLAGRSLEIRMLFVSSSYLATSFFISGLFPLLDNRVFQILTENGVSNKELYGRQRLWGAVGQALVGPLLGKCMEAWGYNAIFASLWICSLSFATAVFLFIPQNTLLLLKQQQQQRPAESKKTKRGSLLRILFDFEFLLFLLMIALGGFSRGVVGNFLTLYLKEYFQMKPGNQGWVMFIRVAPEILCFFISKHIIALLGLVPTLLLALLAGTVRVAIYAFLPVRPSLGNVALLVELLKGVNNALLLSSSAQLAHELAPADSAALAQGLFVGTHGNLATALAGIAGFIVLRIEHDARYPIISLFRVTFVISLIGLLLFVLNQLWVRFRTKRLSM